MCFMFDEFCCVPASPPVAALTFNPLKTPLVVHIDLDNAICDPLNDIIALIPHGYSPLTATFLCTPCCVRLKLTRNHTCESAARAALDPLCQTVPPGIYCLCYLKYSENYSEGYACIGKTRPFPYEYTNMPENSIWVQRNTPFRFPSPITVKSFRNKHHDSDLSGSTSSGGSFVLPHSSFSEDESVADEALIKHSPIHTSAGKIQHALADISNQYNPQTRSFFKCSIFSPTKQQLFAIEERRAEDSQASSPRVVKRSEGSENAITSYESEV